MEITNKHRNIKTGFTLAFHIIIILVILLHPLPDMIDSYALKIALLIVGIIGIIAGIVTIVLEVNTAQDTARSKFEIKTDNLIVKTEKLKKMSDDTLIKYYTICSIIGVGVIAGILVFFLLNTSDIISVPCYNIITAAVFLLDMLFTPMVTHKFADELNRRKWEFAEVIPNGDN